jgi:hypothetical protein
MERGYLESTRDGGFYADYFKQSCELLLGLVLDANKKALVCYLSVLQTAATTVCVVDN